MRPGSCEDKRITFNFINQEPVWLYVQFTITIVFGNDRVVLIFFRNRFAFNKSPLLKFDKTPLFVKKNNFAGIFVFYRRTGRFVEFRSLCLSEFVDCRREKNR